MSDNEKYEADRGSNTNLKVSRVLLTSKMLEKLTLAMLSDIAIRQADLLSKYYIVTNGEKKMCESSTGDYRKTFLNCLQNIEIDIKKKRPLIDIVLAQAKDIDTLEGTEVKFDSSNFSNLLIEKLDDIKLALDDKDSNNQKALINDIIRRVEMINNNNVVTDNVTTRSSVDKFAVNISELLPKFGTSTDIANIDDWIFKVNSIKKRFKLEGTEIIQLIIPRLEGIPLQVVKRLLNENDNLSWNTFENELKNELGSSSMIRTALLELKKINLSSMNNNFNRYVEKYQSLVNRIPNTIVGEEAKVFSFIDGLHPKMQQHVISLKPRNISEAIEHARVSFDCYLKVRENVVSVNSSKPGVS